MYYNIILFEIKIDGFRCNKKKSRFSFSIND